MLEDPWVQSVALSYLLPPIVGAIHWVTLLRNQTGQPSVHSTLSSGFTELQRQLAPLKAWAGHCQRPPFTPPSTPPGFQSRYAGLGKYKLVACVVSGTGRHGLTTGRGLQRIAGEEHCRKDAQTTALHLHPSQEPAACQLMDHGAALSQAVPSFPGITRLLVR